MYHSISKNNNNYTAVDVFSSNYITKNLTYFSKQSSIISLSSVVIKKKLEMENKKRQLKTTTTTKKKKINHKNHCFHPKTNLPFFLDDQKQTNLLLLIVAATTTIILILFFFLLLMPLLPLQFIVSVLNSFNVSVKDKCFGSDSAGRLVVHPLMRMAK